MNLMALDELILKIRNQETKEYFSEAINAYNAGAYRASIMSLWIAVVYDIISKIKELNIQEDPQAKQYVNKIDTAIENNDINTFLSIEQDVLEVAYNKFEFLSFQEHKDLERLKIDRHRCAHPTFSDKDSLFQPVPELVRTHLVYSVKHLLKHQPIQGKSALDRIKKDITSNTFPREFDNVYKFLKIKYLKYAKNSLVRNLIIVLLKEFLREHDSEFFGKKDNIKNSLLAIKNIHTGIYNETMEKKINSILENIDEDKIINSVQLVGLDNQIWNYLEKPNKIKVTTFIKHGNIFISENNFEISNIMNIEEIKDIILDKFSDLDTKNKIKFINLFPHTEFTKKAIKLYREESTCFRRAENLEEKLILPMIEYFSCKDISNILEAVKENGQINHADGTPQIIEILFDKTKKYLPKIESLWKDFGEWLLKKNDKDDYYSFPDLREKMKNQGIVLDNNE